MITGQENSFDSAVYPFVSYKQQAALHEVHKEKGLVEKIGV
jgi:hypothetical protein